MGSQRNGDGSDRPPEGGGSSDGLPGLPPEWGVIIIPDDLSELDQEAEKIRRDLRKEARHDTWRRRLGAPGGQHDGQESPTLGMPLLIMAVAIIAAVTSLFTVTLSGRLDKPVGQAGAGTSASTATTAPDVTLADAAGATVALRDTLPAVVLLVDGCDCADLVNQTATAAPGGVHVLAVGRTVPTFPLAPGSQVRRLTDTSGKLIPTYEKPSKAPQSATVILIRRSGEVAFTAPGVTKVDSFRTELAKLGG